MQNDAVDLIIDHAASTTRPDAEDLRTWMAEQKVFISSVMAGMEDLRIKVADAIREVGATPVYFEDFGGRDDDAEAAYLGEVASSTIYVGVLGRRYGRLLKSRLSATHEEYREAERRGLHISAWAVRGDDFQADQADFLAEVRLFHTTGAYSGPDDLSLAVARRLREIAAADLCPWVKLGDLLFRAQSIRDNGEKLVLRATIRDSGVLTDLENLRPAGWGSKQERRLTFNGHSTPVRIMGVESHTASSRSSSVEISCEHTLDTDVRTPVTAISVGSRTYSADEVTELHFRRALFGERMPRSILTMGGRVDNPFVDMPRDLKSDELRRAVMRLLVTEALVLSGRASRVSKINISPEGPEGQRAVVAWAGPTSRGRRTEIHEINGIIVHTAN